MIVLQAQTNKQKRIVQIKDNVNQGKYKETTTILFTLKTIKSKNKRVIMVALVQSLIFIDIIDY